jgi:hypothetical protein
MDAARPKAQQRSGCREACRAELPLCARHELGVVACRIADRLSVATARPAMPQAMVRRMSWSWRAIFKLS